LQVADQMLCRRQMKTDRKVSIAVTGSVGFNCEVSLMSQKTVHVKLRCMECKAKFDNKYDAFDTSAITNVGQVLQNFIFCQRCGKRVSVVVFDIR
jgi:hypothetical protein